MALFTPSSPSRPYPNGIEVLMIYFTKDIESTMPAQELGRAWTTFGANVTYITEADFRPDVPSDITIGSYAAGDWRSPMAYVDEWLARVDPYTEESSGKLLVVCYHGHGLKRELKGDERLVGWSGEEDEIRFDLTAIKMKMRDDTHSDSLLFLECCFGGFVSPVEEDTRAEKALKSELLAAGGGEEEIYVMNNGMSFRFADALSELEGSKTVERLFDEVLCDYDIAESSGWYEDVGGNGSIVLQKRQ